MPEPVLYIPVTHEQNHNTATMNTHTNTQHVDDYARLPVVRYGQWCEAYGGALGAITLPATSRPMRLFVVRRSPSRQAAMTFASLAPVFGGQTIANAHFRLAEHPPAYRSIIDTLSLQV